MDKKERFRKVYAYLLGAGQISSQEDLAKALDAGTGTVSKAYNQGLVSDNFFKRICAAYPGVFNLDWLLKGEGEMLQASKKPQEPTKQDVNTNNQDGIIKFLIEQNRMFMQMMADNEEYRKKHDAKVDEELSELRGILLRLIKQEYGVATYHDTSLVNDEVKVYNKK